MLVVCDVTSELHYLDVNECGDADVCDTLATCMNLVGSYMCTCNRGYTGDGIVCVGKSMYNGII